MPRRKKDSLTEKEVRFVEEFLIDCNATQAAIRAGYPAKTAAQMGYKLVHSGLVAAAIEAKQQAIVHETGITRERIIEEMGKIAFVNMLDFIRIGPDGDAYVDFSELTREQAAAIGEITVEDFKDGRGKDARDVRKVKFKLLDKKGALVELGKIFGLFKNEAPPTETDRLDELLDYVDGRTKSLAGRR